MIWYNQVVILADGRKCPQGFVIVAHGNGQYDTHAFSYAYAREQLIAYGEVMGLDNPEATLEKRCEMEV